MLSEWEKLSKQLESYIIYTTVSTDPLRKTWYQVKAVGNKLQQELELEIKTRLLVEDELRVLDQKLEAIRNWVLNLRQHGGQVGSIQQVSYANQILEVLSDE